jgi:hypothetical protein
VNDKTALEPTYAVLASSSEPEIARRSVGGTVSVTVTVRVRSVVLPFRSVAV